MDEFDRASDQEQAMRDAAIKNASTVKSALKPCGKCLNCGEEVASELRFCDADCRDDFELRAEEPARTGW
jgi:hypothetical protein